MKTLKLILPIFLAFLTISSKCKSNNTSSDVVISTKVVKIENDDDFVAKTFGIKNDRNTKETRDKYGISTINLQCAISDPVAYATYVAWASEEAAVDASGVVVSTEEEMKAAEETKKQIEKTYKFSEDTKKLKALNILLNNLLDARPASHRDLTYEIYLLESDEVNAFTFGGKIFVSQGIIDKCETVSELAFIIGHEIGHNEVRDINRTLVRIKAAGEFGEIANVVKQLSTVSWNQFNEFRADGYGLNLTYTAGYDPCTAAAFWEKLADLFKEAPDDFEKMFRTHPYSKDRANCARAHIKRVFGIDCE